MGAAKKLTNLQIELLEVFKYELSDTQIKEIRSLLVDYFAEKVTSGMDALKTKIKELDIITKLFFTSNDF